jgi:hydrogenase expression/formation protein HypC
MCIGIPMQVTACEGLIARCDDGTAEHRIDLAMVGPQPLGTWLLTSLGSARQVLSAEQAGLIRDALRAVELVMSGNRDVDHLFADLTDRPRLPPHLAAVVGTAPKPSDKGSGEPES